MANIDLYPTQIEAIEKMHNGCILDGGVGSGKSRTALAYVYFKELKGMLRVNGKGDWWYPKVQKDVYIITTAKKRDSLEWEKEAIPFLKMNYIIDSWNNIKKYSKIYGAIFIFDEQRVVGSGAWVKAFLKITRANRWILLSASPGDSWSDYIPVFIANGFFRNKTDFNTKHVIYKPFRNYPVIDHYINEGLLLYYKSQLLVKLDSQRVIDKQRFKIACEYDKMLYRKIWKDRWNPYDDCPIEETGKLCYLLRRCVSENKDRVNKLKAILDQHPKAIIFYNYSFELHLIQEKCKEWKIKYAGWNGESHDPLPTGEQWVYLCQYTAASEGWNAITTDTIIFYSLSYSYKQMLQAAGRIDRSNTPFKLLYYYYLYSYSPIDLAIQKALKNKKNFNERNFIK